MDLFSALQRSSEMEVAEKTVKSVFPEVLFESPVAIMLCDPFPFLLVLHVKSCLFGAVLKRVKSHKLLTRRVILLEVRAVLAEHESSREPHIECAALDRQNVCGRPSLHWRKGYSAAIPDGINRLEMNWKTADPWESECAPEVWNAKINQARSTPEAFQTRGFAKVSARTIPYAVYRSCERKVDVFGTFEVTKLRIAAPLAEYEVRKRLPEFLEDLRVGGYNVGEVPCRFAGAGFPLPVVVAVPRNNADTSAQITKRCCVNIVVDAVLVEDQIEFFRTDPRSQPLGCTFAPEFGYGHGWVIRVNLVTHMLQRPREIQVHGLDGISTPIISASDYAKNSHDDIPGGLGPLLRNRGIDLGTMLPALCCARGRVRIANSPPT